MLTYADLFYHQLQKGKYKNAIKGFPQTLGSWCKKLKYEYINIQRFVLQQTQGVAKSGSKRQPLFKPFKKQPFSQLPDCTSGDINVVQYLGIASDETERIKKHINKKNIVLPLVDKDWEEDYCGLWCKYNNLLSPSYTSSTRDGCWFCHNQGVEQLRYLRRKYPDLWKILLQWDLDSPVTFKADGHTVHDYDKRFEMEDDGLIDINEPFFWKHIDNPPPQQLKILL